MEVTRLLLAHTALTIARDVDMMALAPQYTSWRVPFQSEGKLETKR